MGLAVAQLRCIYLGFLRSDLEFKIQTITQTKMGLATTMSDLLNVGTDLDPESPEMKQLEHRKKKLQLIEKRLDAQLSAYQAKLSMIEKEQESAKKMFESGLQVFSYGGSR